MYKVRNLHDDHVCVLVYGDTLRTWICVVCAHSHTHILMGSNNTNLNGYILYKPHRGTYNSKFEHPSLHALLPEFAPRRLEFLEET